MNEKTCTKCHTAKPPAAFPPNKRSADKLDYWCRACRREVANARSQAEREKRPPKPPAAIKTHHKCEVCDQLKPLAEFNRNRSRSNGHDAWCKVCRRAYYKDKDYFRKHYEQNKARKQELSKKRYEKNGDVIRTQARLSRYGITAAEYTAMIESHNGQCAICGSESGGLLYGSPKSLCVDHNHATGKVRGLLCHKCNYAIGLFKDDPDLVRKAATYLEKYQEPSDDQVLHQPAAAAG